MKSQNMLPEIQSDIDRLKYQVKLISELPSETPIGVLSMTYQLMCVSIVGRLEQNLKLIFIDYAEKNSKKKVSRAISRLCQSFQNPKFDKIIDLISLFDRDFSERCKDEWMSGDEPIKLTINNMVGERITIAHQRTKNFSVTLSKIKKYLAVYIDVISEVSDHFTK